MARRVLALLLLHLLFISVTHCKQQVMQKVMQKVDITQVMQKVIISLLLHLLFISVTHCKQQ